MKITFITFTFTLSFFFTVIIVSLLSSLAHSEQIGSCGLNRANEFEDCFARALMVSDNQTFPENSAQVETMCT